VWTLQQALSSGSSTTSTKRISGKYPFQPSKVLAKLNTTISIGVKSEVDKAEKSLATCLYCLREKYQNKIDMCGQ